jgi:hypothetical protein
VGAVFDSVAVQYSAARLFKMDKAKRHQYWTFDVERSMFDVQYGSLYFVI